MSLLFDHATDTFDRAVVADWDTLRYDQQSKCTGIYEDFYNYYEQTGRLNGVEPEFIPV